MGKGRAGKESLWVKGGQGRNGQRNVNEHSGEKLEREERERQERGIQSTGRMSTLCRAAVIKRFTLIGNFQYFTGEDQQMPERKSAVGPMY